MNDADDVAVLLAEFPEQTQAVASELRGMVRALVPDARESVDRPARMIAYSYGNRLVDLVFTVFPSKKGVKLGIPRGASLPDPHGLLAGEGKVSRHLAFITAADLRRSGVKTLMRSAVTAWKRQAKAAGTS